MAQMRTIREEKPVSQAIEEAKAKYPRIEEIYEGLAWRLAREPEVGYQLPNVSPPTFIYKIQPTLTDQPAISVLYRYSDDLVEILAIRISCQK